MHPFATLMRRYSIDFAQAHGLAVIDDVMLPEYTVHTAGLTLMRDPDYKPTVTQIFKLFPGLGFVVHDVITNGDRLAMRFSEHGMTPPGRASAWRGIGLYDWNGTQLSNCWVEQDFYARRRQLKTGRPDLLEPPHLDAWVGAVTGNPSAEAEFAATRWLRTGDLAAAASGWIDDAAPADYCPPTDEPVVTINDLFSVDDQVAFHVTLRGELRAGFDPDCDRFTGKAVDIGVAGIVRVDGNGVADVKAVSDRLGLRSRVLDLPLTREA